MRTLFGVVGTIATVNLLALLALGSWLVATERIDQHRVALVRELFSAPPGHSDVERAVHQVAMTDQGEGEDVEGASSATLVSHADHVAKMTTDSRRMLETERDMLLRQVETARAALERDRVAFDAEVQTWTAARDAAVRQRRDEQFLQTVRLMSNLPKQAKSMLVGLMNEDRSGEAVAYLDAMTSHAAQRVLREFRSPPEQALAAQLLDHLHRYDTPDPSAMTIAP